MKKFKLKRIVWINRWSQPTYIRADDWVVFGVAWKWQGNDFKRLMCSFFGFQVHLIFKK